MTASQSIRLCLGATVTVLFGCGSSPETTTVDAGPPVPDPGGPFVADIAPDRAIASLNGVEVDTLCRDLANADFAFLASAVQAQNFCRQDAVESGHSTGLVPPAFDMRICAEDYAMCIGGEMSQQIYRCPFLIAYPNPQPCDATVEDLSACLNEIAMLDPVAACVTTPDCDAAAAAVQQANASPPATTDAGDGWDSGEDAAWLYTGPPDTGPPDSPRYATPPACQRLYQICPVLKGWATVPC